MDKVVISKKEIAEVADTVGDPLAPTPQLPPVISWQRKVALSVLVLALPLLCLAAAIVRIALRNRPLRTTDAWTAYFSTLLVISGLLTSAAFVVVLSIAPPPAVGSAGLPELDERARFPKLPSLTALDGEGVSEVLKPLVVVVSPAAKWWFARQETPSNSFGAGALLEADSNGYLFVTARHVVAEAGGSPAVRRAFVAGISGAWAIADIVGLHRGLDLALLWLPRRTGSAEFAQPMASPKDGQPIFVIGHPQGFRFSMSNGMISREQDDTIQITAPVSPGNSGGPVYDDHGTLVGIVSSTTDKSTNPNAENLNFAVATHALRDASGWDFFLSGRQYFDRLTKANAESNR